MKIGIITHYDVHNHGAVLQLYAMTKVLINEGHCPIVLGFKKNYDFLGENAYKKYDISIKSIPFYINYLIKNGFKKTIFNIKKNSLLKEFKKNFNLNEVFYFSQKSLDVVLIGSDEVFSISSGLNAFFWGMGVPCKKIISYAASFGKTDFNEIMKKNSQEFIEAGIKRISAISVRDFNSYSIIKRISSIESEIVCDPVILYDFKREFYSKQKMKLPFKDYILIYSYDNNMNDKETIISITKLAKKMKCKILSVGFYHNWTDNNINADPISLLYYFKNSKLVITDTFHGAVMSLINNSQFLVKINNNSNKLLFLLTEYNLQNRIFNHNDEIESILKNKIEFTVINDLIKVKRDQSLKFLRDSLNN
jgi:polysaccharide pyruvyl transferase WcaK-like protein